MPAHPSASIGEFFRAAFRPTQPLQTQPHAARARHPTAVCIVQSAAAAGRPAAGRLGQQLGPVRRQDAGHRGRERPCRSTTGQGRRAGHHLDHRQGQPATARHSAVGHRGDREAHRRPQSGHAEGCAAEHRRRNLPGGRGRRGRHPPARLLVGSHRRHLHRRHARPGLLRPRHLQPGPHRPAARLGLDAVRPGLHGRRREPGQQAAASGERARNHHDHRQPQLPPPAGRLQLQDG